MKFVRAVLSTQKNLIDLRPMEQQTRFPKCRLDLGKSQTESGSTAHKQLVLFWCNLGGGGGVGSEVCTDMPTGKGVA